MKKAVVVMTQRLVAEATGPDGKLIVEMAIDEGQVVNGYFKRKLVRAYQEAFECDDVPAIAVEITPLEGAGRV